MQKHGNFRIWWWLRILSNSSLLFTFWSLQFFILAYASLFTIRLLFWTFLSSKLHSLVVLLPSLQGTYIGEISSKICHFTQKIPWNIWNETFLQYKRIWCCIVPSLSQLSASSKSFEEEGLGDVTWFSSYSEAGIRNLKKFIRNNMLVKRKYTGD